MAREGLSERLRLARGVRRGRRPGTAVLVMPLRLPGVFRPRSDTWLLADALAREPLPRGAVVLELCAGTGVVAVRAARDLAARVTAVDVSRRAVATCRLNGLRAGLRIEAVRGSLFAPVAGRRFDAIAANPPYVPAAGDDLPRHGVGRAVDAGRDGRALIDPIIAAAPAHLIPGGVLLLVHSSVCGTGETLRRLGRAGLRAEVLVRRPGPLGPLMRERAPMLRRRGMLPADREELVVVRGTLPGGAHDV